MASAIDLLTPRNVVLGTSAGQAIVEALDPQTMVTVTGQPALRPVADEADRRLRAAPDCLRESRGTR